MLFRSKIDYAENAQFASFDTADNLFFVNNSGINTGLSATAAYTPTTVDDWYNLQTLDLDNSIIYWKSIAPKPISNQYVLSRNGEGDGMHIVVVDDYGTITGNQGTILEKHVGISKAYDTISGVNSPQKIWYKQYLAEFSTNVYAEIGRAHV